MSITSQQYANLTAHAYGEEHNGKKGQMRHLVKEEITLEGVPYKLLEYMDKDSGYQGAIYQRMDTGQIVVAHRGTEFDREAIKDGLIADGGMVAARTNSQMADAIALTQRALDLAKDPKNLSEYGQISEVTVTGHSLGGVLAQITAYKFGLRGETFNAYGAVSLGHKIPEGGTQVVNHVKASDPVSAASKHFGQVRQYASAQDVRAVGAVADYDNDRDRLDMRDPVLAIRLSLGAHRMHHSLP
jgi:pimeloyl-ACP methyl ester carboxylesterase